MKRFLSLLILFITAGAVQSQAPVTSGAVTASLQQLINGNKTLIDTQKKTLDALDQLDQNAKQLKIFGKRS
jgi:hypothetical protein